VGYIVAHFVVQFRGVSEWIEDCGGSLWGVGGGGGIFKDSVWGGYGSFFMEGIFLWVNLCVWSFVGEYL